MTCTLEININIKAKPDVVWKLLNDAAEFPRCTSTVARMKADLREGERLRLHAPGTKRVFTPCVSRVVPNQCMVFSDGVSTPIYSAAFVLDPQGNNIEAVFRGA